MADATAGRLSCSGEIASQLLRAQVPVRLSPQPGGLSPRDHGLTSTATKP
jgi:hypothetical protein